MVGWNDPTTATKREGSHRAALPLLTEHEFHELNELWR